MYKLTQGSSILRLSDGAFIPADPENTDYQVYQTWLKSGGVPEPADPATPLVTTVVTMRQARLALLQAGLLTQVNAAVAGIPSPAGDAARITWEFSSEVRRDDPLVAQLAAALNLTSDQLDQLFTVAGGL